MANELPYNKNCCDYGTIMKSWAENLTKKRDKS